MTNLYAFAILILLLLPRCLYIKLIHRTYKKLKRCYLVISAGTFSTV
ncbi:hypothetical protein PAGA_a0732 [Pseudoalteromonas agarivorans DSM 14585]|uniref:Uncharacterized protein n=1 Tax=Pseudoalteromonas agarivorans DSM 14585 TaxID=1312369 RepID=A0ACA8DSX7_9GAMM|nr:hypothetical protein PAGA_a0732 [Pseudoalteromonas agarivorans DSM 14585]